MKRWLLSIRVWIGFNPIKTWVFKTFFHREWEHMGELVDDVIRLERDVARLELEKKAYMEMKKDQYFTIYAAGSFSKTVTA